MAQQESWNWDDWARGIVVKRGPEGVLATLASSVSNWPLWLQQLREQRLSVPLMATLRDAGYERLLPEDVQQALKEDLREATSRLSEQTAAMEAAGEALSAEKVDWLLLRQPSLEAAAPSPAGGYSPVYFLVPPLRESHVRQVLEGAGWQPHQSSVRASDYEAPQYVHPEYSHTAVVVQTSLLPGVANEEDGTLWEDSERIPLGNGRVPVAASPVRAVHAALVAVIFYLLQRPADVLQYAREFQRLDHSDWDRVVEIAINAGVGWQVAVALREAEERQYASMPSRAARKLDQDPAPALRRNAASSALRRPGSPAAVGLFRLLAMRDYQARESYLDHLLFPRPQHQASLPVPELSLAHGSGSSGLVGAALALLSRSS